MLKHCLGDRYREAVRLLRSRFDISALTVGIPCVGLTLFSLASGKPQIAPFFFGEVRLSKAMDIF